MSEFFSDFVFVDFFFAKKSFFAEVEIEASDRVKDATGNAALSKILAENEFFRSSIFRVSVLASASVASEALARTR